MIVQYVNRQSKYPLTRWRQLLSKVLPAALEATPAGQQLNGENYETMVSVTFAGPRVMRRINADTRQVDRLTDVLSYPMLEMENGRMTHPPGIEDCDPAYPDRPTIFLGDLVISLDRAFHQAGEYGHTSEREVAFLAVHGLLHLLGYDHADDKQEKNMVRLQNRILDLVGIRRGDQHD